MPARPLVAFFSGSPKDIEGVAVRGRSGGLQAAQQRPPPAHPLLPPVGVYGMQERLAERMRPGQGLQGFIPLQVPNLGHKAWADALRHTAACIPQPPYHH